MQFRDATPADVPALAVLGRESFTDAFGHLYSQEDLSSFLAEVHDEARIRGEVEGPDCRHRLAVSNDGSLLGFCKLRYPSKFTDLSEASRPIELAQLYCAASATGQGIGGRLMDWALEQAETGGHDAIHLSVYSENYGAQRFYERYGFAHTVDTTFKVGEQLDHEYVYEKPLKGETA